MNSYGKQAGGIFCLLIALACFSWYFASSQPLVQLDDEALANTVDTIVTRLVVKQYDAGGSLANLLESPKMQHIALHNTHLLKSPHIVVKQPGKPVWDISSRRAKAINGGKQITFRDQVVVHQAKGSSTQESTMKTEQLVYFPKTRFATSPVMVTVAQPGSTVRSRGINAWLNDKHVVLLNKAHATYEPDHA